MGNLQSYGEFSLEDVDDIERASSRGAPFLKLKEGKTDVRILPPRQGEKPIISYWQHFLTAPDGTKAGFACAAKSASKGPCPVCDMARRLAAGGTEADNKRAKAYWPRVRYVANVIDRSDENGGPKVLGFGSKMWDQIKEIRKDPDVGGDFTDPKVGFDLRINRTGSGQFDTEYKILPGRPKPLSGDQAKIDQWVAGQPNLTDFMKPLPYETVMEKLGSKATPAKALPPSDDDEFAAGPWGEDKPKADTKADRLGSLDDPDNQLKW